MAKYKHQRLFTLNNPYSPRLCPELAKEIGLNESIMLLQIEFWIATQGKEREDGHLWLRKTIREVQQEFPYWGTGTIGRILEALISKGYIVAAGLDDGPGRSGRWMRFDFERLSTLQSIRVLSHSGKTVFPNNEDSVPDGDIRPYIEEKDTLRSESALPPVSSVSKFVSKRSRPQSNGHQKKLPTPERLPMAKGLRPVDEAVAQVERRYEGIDTEEVILKWRAKRLSDGALSADWNADFIYFASNYQQNVTERQNRYAERDNAYR